MLAINFGLFLRTIKSDTEISIWVDGTKDCIFNSKAYKLYDNEEIKKRTIIYLMYHFDGISIKLKKE